jgi:hypothetical protein
MLLNRFQRSRQTPTACFEENLMTNRRRLLQLAGSTFLLTENSVWAEPGDWAATLGTALDISPHDVQVRRAQFKNQAAVAVELSTDAQKRALNGGGNGPTIAILNNEFANGVIEVDVAGSMNGKGSPDSRAFVGVAFHVAANAKTFEAVYLRMSNGTKNNPSPPPPRNLRAVQYVAHPDFHFDVSRQQFPEKYEKAAPVALDTWHRLRLDIAGSRLRAEIDGVGVLLVDDLRFANHRGAIGLFVDDGTTGYFANLSVKPRLPLS